MYKLLCGLLGSTAICSTTLIAAELPPIGAAPTGDAKTVASKIIKHNFPTCKNVTKATRLPDGSIGATCDTNDFLVFTMFNAKEGKTVELAMNCTAAKTYGINCYRNK